MELQSLLKKPLPQMLPEIINSLRENAITPTSFENKNGILSNAKLQTEVGYTKMDDGTYLVAMVCPNPKAVKGNCCSWLPQCKDF